MLWRYGRERGERGESGEKKLSEEGGKREDNPSLKVVLFLIY